MDHMRYCTLNLVRSYVLLSTQPNTSTLQEVSNAHGARPVLILLYNIGEQSLCPVSTISMRFFNENT